MSTEDPKQVVLIIDDDELAREAMTSLLLREPVEVAVASSGEAGLAYAAANRVDVILCDVMMPGMDGMECCRRLKADPQLKSVPVILVTALDTPAEIARGLEAGAEEFVSKPVNRMEMRARVRSMLRLKRQHDELREANERLSRLHRHRERLASFLVHDLKNPLAIITANASFCVLPTQSADVRESMADIRDAVCTMDRMVMDLLDVAGGEDEGLPLKLSDVRLGERLRALIESFGPLMRARRITIQISDTTTERVCCDADLLVRVATNLLDNGLKYAPAGSELGVELTLSGGAFELRLRDSGQGIPAAERDRIFEKYQRVEGVEDTNARSSRGLGLAFCRMAVEAHGGRIWIEENQPCGTVFCFSIPQPPRRPTAP